MDVFTNATLGPVTPPPTTTLIFDTTNSAALLVVVILLFIVTIVATVKCTQRTDMYKTKIVLRTATESQIATVGVVYLFDSTTLGIRVKPNRQNDLRDLYVTGYGLVEGDKDNALKKGATKAISRLAGFFARNTSSYSYSSSSSSSSSSASGSGNDDDKVGLQFGP